MTRKLEAEDFLKLDWALIDVRSPGEFACGHIPGAVNIPLFSDEERAIIGTLYKQQGKEKAIETGLSVVGPKLKDFVQLAKQNTSDKNVRIHCWRGGMRSSSMAWLLETAGLTTVLLEGGYKSYRKWVRDTLSIPHEVIILAGMTGTGKTEILIELEKSGEQVLDLEKLASHRGSSFGNIGLGKQPSTEEFENKIAEVWKGFTAAKPVWLESESKKIGTCIIPAEIQQQMQTAISLQIERSTEERIDILAKEYGKFDANVLVAATMRIQKKLGGLACQKSIDAILAGDIKKAAGIILSYYDKTYAHALQKRQIKKTITITGKSAFQAAKILMETYKTTLRKFNDIN